MIILRVVGRLIFVLFLLIYAYNHLTNPSSFVTSFKRSYQQSRQIHPTFSYLPDQNQIQKHVKIAQLIQSFGVLEIVISLLIFIGDRVGGVLLCLYLIIYGVGAFLKELVWIIRVKDIQKFYQLLPDLVRWSVQLGMGIIFIKRPHLQQQKMPV